MTSLGFMSAILPELPLSEVLQIGRELGYDCVELMCWPVGKAERRYAGVTHVDVTDISQTRADEVRGQLAQHGVALSGLGYYPNALSPDAEEAARAVEHLRRVIRAAPMLGTHVVNTFVGRDFTKTVDENWPRFLEVWNPLVAYAEDLGVRIAIENCPMTFTRDEWPAGKNLAHSPAIWRRMFSDVGRPNLGLNYDPSHMIWQQMDYLRPMREFRDRIFHVHAKDVRIDVDRLNEVGILAYPNSYHTPKLPGLGEVDWGRFFAVLTEVGYRGPVCVEVEDRAYEGSLAGRRAALRQSATYLRNFVPKM